MEQIILHIIILLLWIIYSSIFGYCDAYFWYSANVGKYCLKDFKFKDLHPQFFWLRSIVGIVFGLTLSNGNYLNSLLYTICLGMILPFFHNGFYYQTRNKIDSSVYPKGFRDMSKTSIANVNFTFPVRTSLMMMGVIGLALLHIINR